MKNYPGKRYQTVMTDKRTGKQITWESDRVTVENNLRWVKPLKVPKQVLDPIMAWATDVRIKMADTDRKETDNQQPTGEQ